MVGNVVNRMMENVKGQPEPKVGMGATEYCYSDRHAYTVVEVLASNRIVVQRDRAIRADKNGMSDSQKYRYELDPKAPREVLIFKKTKKVPHGRWVRKSEGIKGLAFVIGYRDEHYDFSF